MFINWLKISDYWWDIIKWSDDGLRRVVSVAARKRNISDVRDALFKLRQQLIAENRVSDYYALYHPDRDSIADLRIHEDW